jgi:hypothetical protein
LSSDPRSVVGTINYRDAMGYFQVFGIISNVPNDEVKSAEALQCECYFVRPGTGMLNCHPPSPCTHCQAIEIDMIRIVILVGLL